jgi:hypothetical protein
VSGRAFIGSDGEGNRAAGGGAPLLAIQFDGEGKQRG